MYSDDLKVVKDTSDFNSNGRLLKVVCAVTPEQIKIKSKLFLSGTWFHSLTWFETQSTVMKKVIADFAMRTIFAYFSKIFVFEKLLAWLLW